MENIQTLLAAVAQTQGFEDDDDPLDVSSPQLGFPTSASSPMTSVEMVVPPLTVDSHDSSDDCSPAIYPRPLARIDAVDKRKRGRPAKEQVLTKLPPLPKRKKVEDEDEDVCFICFDGGSLVLCDKKGCPKAYHTACIKRDEAFFKTKAKWNCGWHICSVCRRNSHYMCYTCTYSLCRGCTKDADYVSVRGNKGFCSTCMKTIMLLENTDQANTEAVKVDFDDKLSWEYLFKVYWVYLKEKLLLTMKELIDAKKPWKGVSPLACKLESTHVHNPVIDEKPSTPHVKLESTHVHNTVIDEILSTPHVNPQPMEANKPNEEISNPHSNRLEVESSVIDNLVATEIGGDKENPSSNKKEAEKPIMDRFNAQPIIVNDTDESGISKATETPGIKEEISLITVEDTNKPCTCKHKEKSRDRNEEKLKVLNNFQWASKDLLDFVAHMNNGDTSARSPFDVQKQLIDYIKRNKLRDPQQKSQIICDSRLTNLFGKARVGHIEMLKLLEFHFPVKEDVQKNSFIPAAFVGSSATVMEIDGDNQTMPVKSRKRKIRKKSEEKAPENNLTEYAAIDFHNINLIFLRRNLMENLVEDKEKFNDKVLGSIVRIRISSNDQKPDVYRLVQVVGTSKVSKPYKIGDKMADIVLEVLNLDKKEAVSIDSISDQEFTEDECRRLRQSIRCGLMKQFTVGELQKKAMTLQPVKLNGWLEAEIMRLNHLRDRASEKGHKKELRECVHKLQLLKSPEERKRRISRVPEIHADPKMSPTYESEEDSRTVINSKNIQDSRSVDNNVKDGHLKPVSSEFARSGRNSNSPNKKSKQDAPIQTQVRVANSAIGGGNDQARQRSGSETSVAAPHVRNLSSDNIETEKLWHYRDPNGKIQGPFAMMQLRKWNTTGLFPTDMRIWTNHEQFDSLLLTAALSGKYHGASEQPHKSSPDTLKTSRVIGKSHVNGIGGGSQKKVAALSNNAIEQKAAPLSKHAVERKVEALSKHAVERKVAASSDHKVQQKVATILDHTVEQKGAAAPDHTTEEKVGAAQNHTVEENVALLSDHAAGQKESASSNDGTGLSDHAVAQKKETSYHAVEQKEETSSNHGINVSNHAVETKEEPSSSHGFDLSNPAIEHKEAASSNNGFDLSDPAIEHKEAASSIHGFDLSHPAIEQKEEASSNHGIDLSSFGRQQNEATSSSHALDISNHAIEQKEAVLPNHEVDLLKHAVERVETVSSSHEVDLSKHAVERVETVSPSHGIDLSKHVVERVDTVSSCHGIDLSKHAVEQVETVSFSHGVDLSNHAVEQVETVSSSHRIDLSNHAVDQKEVASYSHGNDVSNHVVEQAEVASSNQAIDLSIPAIEQKEEAVSNQAIDSTGGNGRAARTDESGSSWPQCWDLLKDDTTSHVEDVQEQIVPPPSGIIAQTSDSLPDRSPDMNGFNHVSQIEDIKSSVQALTEMIFGDELQDQSDSHSQGQTVPSSAEHPTFHIDLMSSNGMEFDDVFTPVVDVIKQEKHLGLSDFNESLAEKQQSLSSNVPLQTTTGILELLSPTPRCNVEDQGVEANEGKQPGLIDLSLPVCGPSWTSLLMGDDWSGFSPTPEKAPVNEWDPGLLASSSMRPHEVTNENVAVTSHSNHNNNPFSHHHTSWLAMLNEPIEFDALGEESVSDLLAEVDAMESQHGGGGFPSPTSAMKFAKELLLDSKDDCFSSIEEFSSTHGPGRSDAFSATDNNHTNTSNNHSIDLNPPIDALDSFRRSAAHSSASSEGETNNPPVYSSREGGGSDFHHSTQNMIMQDIFGTPPGSSESMDPGWGGVPGNINLVTVQGNVNLVLGGHGQGMANLNWATNQGNPWVNPIMNPSPRNGSSLPWEQLQQQRKYGGGERFVSPRDWNNNNNSNNYQGGGRPPWGRQVYGGGGGGGYSRPIPKGQRVCKFYEIGRCKKGAFCDYLHP